MKTFTKFRQQLPVFEEHIFLEELSSEDLYSIISEDNISEELLESAILTLFARGEIELSENDLQKSMSTTIGSVPLSYIAKRKEGIKAAAELEKQSKAPPKKPFRMDEPNTTITKTPGGLVKFPAKSPDNTKSMSLTGKTFDPTKAALSSVFSASSPEPTKKPIGPVGGTKSDSTTSQKPVIAQKSVAKQASAAQKLMQKAPVASKPIQKAPLQKKSLPSTNKPEADPNVGGGFVTAGVSKGPGGNLRTTNVSRGNVDATALPHKNTSLTQPLQKAKNVSYAKPKDWKQSSPLGTTGQKLAPQGSAERDSQLSKMGYKKF